jgi:sulfur transfer complex TusBCD TusB component (DsrH family)
MEIPTPVVKYASIGLFAAILVLLAVGGVKKMSYDKRIAELQNAVAEKDRTLETHLGVYEKLAIQTEALKGLLDQKNAQVAALTKDLNARGEELLVANNLVVFWKKKYEAQGTGTQTVVPGDGPAKPERLKVSFSKDFGYIGVNGYTITSPPEYFVSVDQKRPLKMTLVVGQLKDGSWKASVTSSEENVGVDIAVAAVNPHIFDDHWYEKLGLSLDLGVGANGFLGGVGASYRFGKFDVGPKVWLSAGGSGVNVAYGAGLVWRPFDVN